jgi:hypothetical protein
MAETDAAYDASQVAQRAQADMLIHIPERDQRVRTANSKGLSCTLREKIQNNFTPFAEKSIQYAGLPAWE